jgi:hypothetical protein
VDRSVEGMSESRSVISALYLYQFISSSEDVEGEWEREVDQCEVDPVGLM